MKKQSPSVRVSIFAVGLFAVGCSDGPAPTNTNTVTDAGNTTVTDAGNTTVTDAGNTTTVTDAGNTSDTGNGADSGTTTDVGSATPDAGTTTTDAGNDADASADPWACLGHVTAPVAESAMGTMRVRIKDFQANTPLVGLTVKACAMSDAACASPHSTGITDAMGIATLTYPMSAAGFGGYVETTGGMGTNAVTPSLFFFATPPSMTNANYDFVAVTQATFTLLSSVFSARLDSTHGAISFFATDCNHQRAAGISSTLTPAAMGAQRFYFVGALPNLIATETDRSGIGGYLDVPPGMYSLEARRPAPKGPSVRVGTVSFAVRGGFMSMMNLEPTP